LLGARLPAESSGPRYSTHDARGVPAIVTEVDQVLDLGNGVVFQAVTQRGSPAGNTGDIRQRLGRGLVVVDGLIETLTSYNDIAKARAAAERLAEERG
jgi:hypothetical protein